MRTRPTLALALAAALAATAAPAAAQLTPDPVGDFLGTYTGPRNAELDVVGAGFVFNGSSFQLISRSAGPLSTSSGAVFVWGVNRGRGTAGFAAIGVPGVLFDAVVSVNPTAGTATVTDLILGGGARALPVGSYAVSGDLLTIDVGSAFLPLLSGGFAGYGQYTANLWPRSGAAGTGAIADFAPDNSNITATVTPEPGTAALLLPAAGLLAAWRRRRRAA